MELFKDISAAIVIGAFILLALLGLARLMHLEDCTCDPPEQVMEVIRHDK